MLNIKNIETKIWTATTAICSSILTSILSDSITTSDFIVIEENNQIIITELLPGAIITHAQYLLNQYE